MTTALAPAPGASGYGRTPTGPKPGAHGTEVDDFGGATFEALKRKTGGFVSPHAAGSAHGDDPKRYAHGFAYDFGQGGMQIRPFGADNPHEPNSEPARDFVTEDGRVLKVVNPGQPSGTASAAVVHSIPEHTEQAPRLPMPALSPAPISPAGVTIPLVDKHRITFITDIGPFECKCISATISDDMWITLMGDNLPKIEAGKTVRMEIDGKQYNCYAPGISVDLHVGPYKVRVTHFAIKENE